MKKRLFSLTMALLLCLGALVFPAGAAENDPLPVLWLPNNVQEVYGVIDGCILISEQYDISKNYSSTRDVGIDFSGHTVIPSGYYLRNAYGGFGNLIGVQNGVYLNGKGEIIADPYGLDYLSSVSHGLVAVKTETGWGVIDENNETVVEPIYVSAVVMDENVIKLKLSEEEGEEDKYLYVDRVGNELFRTNMDFWSFSEGLFGLNGDFYDLSGKRVIDHYDYSMERPNQWSDVTNWGPSRFSEGLALDFSYAYERDDDGNGHYFASRLVCIDTAGNIVFERENVTECGTYDSVSEFSGGLAPLGICDGFDEEGNGINERCGYIDHSGEFVIEPVFSSARNFKYGLATVSLDPDCSYSFNDDYFGSIIDSNGTILKSDGKLLGNGRYGVCRRRTGSGYNYQYGIFENPYHPDYSAENALKARDLQAEADTARKVRITAMAAAAVLVVVVVILIILKKTAKKRKEKKAVRKEQQAAKAAAVQAKRRIEAALSGNVTCSCGTVNPATVKFCSGCGKPVVVPGRCPSCGHQNEPGAKFCQGCGKPIEVGEDKQDEA